MNKIPFLTETDSHKTWALTVGFITSGLGHTEDTTYMLKQKDSELKIVPVLLIINVNCFATVFPETKKLKNLVCFD